MSEIGGENVVRVEPKSKRRDRRLTTLALLVLLALVVGIPALIIYIIWLAMNTELGLYLFILLPFILYATGRLAEKSREKK